jgi:hypothetical protein
MKYKSKDEAIKAALDEIDAMVRRGDRVFANHHTQAYYIEVNGEVFEYPQPIEIPPAMTPVWVRDLIGEDWEGPFVSKGLINDEGWLRVYGCNSWKYWSTTKPEGWEP